MNNLIRDIIAQNLASLREMTAHELKAISENLGLFQRSLTRQDGWFHDIYIPTRLGMNSQAVLQYEQAVLQYEQAVLQYEQAVLQYGQARINEIKSRPTELTVSKVQWDNDCSDQSVTYSKAA